MEDGKVFSRFGEALGKMEDGEVFSRDAWNKRCFIAQQNPDENSKMGKPYLYMIVRIYGKQGYREEGYRVPWTPNQEDLFASDYIMIEGFKK